ncbi:MAG TPA: hypothetical protein VGK20_18750 [Candidatus Binatia bacterium]
MTRSTTSVLAAVLAGGLMLFAPQVAQVAQAAKGDCGQPSSSGASPVSSDALTILKSSVGQPTACDDSPSKCDCDVNNSNTVTASDALLDLKKAVGQDVTLTCSCSVVPQGIPCTSAVFHSRTGSDLDSGWTGIAHNSDLEIGSSISFDVMKRCTDNNAQCQANADCVNNNCKATCDCSSDTTCDITGPTDAPRCVTTLKGCTTNTDCPTGVACVHTFGPPLPLSSGGTPVCVVSVFDSVLTGTADTSTGEAVTSASLKSRVFLGIAIDKPCPRCGAPADHPQIGGTFTCSGGQFDAAVCHVDALSPVFGGTSFDCPPALNANVSGAGLEIRFSQVTTGTSTKTAQLPCANSQFLSNPLNAPFKCYGGTNAGKTCSTNTDCPGSAVPGPCQSHPGKCLDNNAACSTNADCKRCTGDSSIQCTADNQCTGNGSCGEAPDQPVTCGFWCQCGFCNGDASLPCFETGDCPSGQTCQVGPGSGNVQNAPQQEPNSCSSDKFICGQFASEQCATSVLGKCTEQSYRSCTSGTTTCEDNNAGTCDIEPKPCFESRITRTGSPSPLGTYCAFQDKTCTTNADCTQSGDFCVKDSARPQTVALFCVPGTSSSSINSVGGITGPGAVSLKGFIEVCRCGDGKIGCDEQCDDGNTVNGDGCDDFCQTEHP